MNVTCDNVNGKCLTEIVSKDETKSKALMSQLVNNIE